MTQMNARYQTPTLEKIGGFEALTQAGATGLHFDGNFQVGDPVPPGASIFS